MNEQFYWTIVQWEKEQNRWEVNDNFENERHKFFTTSEISRLWTMNDDIVVEIMNLVLRVTAAKQACRRRRMILSNDPITNAEDNIEISRVER